jgi:hypothetical protein
MYDPIKYNVSVKILENKVFNKTSEILSKLKLIKENNIR